MAEQSSAEPLLVRAIHALVGLGLVQEEMVKADGVTRRKGEEAQVGAESQGPMLRSRVGPVVHHGELGGSERWASCSALLEVVMDWTHSGDE